jgi:hypothetical protein
MQKVQSIEFFVYVWFFHGHVPGKNTLTRRFFRRKTVKSAPQCGTDPTVKKSADFLTG